MNVLWASMAAVGALGTIRDRWLDRRRPVRNGRGDVQ